MQLAESVIYFLFTITVASSYLAHANGQSHELETKPDRRISKRDSAIYIDSYPIEPIYKHRPKIIYRRISKQRYRSPKPKYGPPIHYRAHSRKPVKKYRGKPKPKYGVPSYKRQPSKPKYGPPKLKYKAAYIPSKKIPISYFPPEPTSFGEPPDDNTPEFPKKQHFGEPPTDSYGTSITEDAIDPYISEHFSHPSYSHSSSYDHFDASFSDEYKPWQNFQEQSYDNNLAYSKIRPVFATPESETDEDFDSNPYSNGQKYSHVFDENPAERKRKPYYFNESIKFKQQRPKQPAAEPEDEVLVGGRYAEPPARYVPKYQQIASFHSYDDDFVPLRGFVDPDIAISATMSPYVNYKHSNVAFSPQNLNDAFSIVEK